ncbi:spermatogenesis associated 2-like [Lates calcarifer]|nr:spermatogenesis associated 2-like [Lates calcarifer]
MSSSRQRARDLLTAYDHSLERQIVGRGSSLACRDEELWKQVEGLLKDGDAQETHCLGLDPLRVMEESLKAATASTTAASGGQVKTRGGLQGLAKAFEVLEQAALNLYLSPWRNEYKVVKMYSGMFTHYIKPVLSVPQIEKLFGLLGYQPSLSRHEQLFLQSIRTSPASLDDLLHLSCAFYLARCECRLLQMTLGNYAGEAQWELSVVRERQRGNSLQVALDNTRKTLKVNQPLMEPFNGEADVDLYTDEHVNGGQREVVVNDNESPCSLTWMTQSNASPPAVKTHSNGMTPLSSSSTSLPTREHLCISTLNYQLTERSSKESDSSRISTARRRQGRHPCEESRFDKADLQSQAGSLQLEAMGLSKSETEVSCSCLQSPHHYQSHCIECETWHSNTCALLEHCCSVEHSVVTSFSTAEEMKESGAVSTQSEILRVSDLRTSPSLTTSSAVMSSLSLCDKSIIHPISYHDCCNLSQLDPEVLCYSCSVFHSLKCRNVDYCKVHHTIKQLRECVCGKPCSRKPLVLCRYCGNEYCTDCWYRNPVICKCGQTFDQSSSV